MAWGTPTALGTVVNTTVAAHSGSISSVTVSAGVLVIVVGAMNAHATGDTIVVSDSVNGTTGWTVHTRYRGTNVGCTFVAFSLMPSGLSSGSITVEDTATGSTNFGSLTFQAYSVTGNASSNVEDTAAFNANDSNTGTTTPSIVSGTPANTGDLFVSTYMSLNSVAATGYTEDAAWSALLAPTGHGSPAQTAAAGYVVNAGSGTKTHAPTTNSVVYAQTIIAFVVSGGAVVSHKLLSSMGVG